MGVLIIGIACTSYRKGQRLAWYVLFWIFAASLAGSALALDTGGASNFVAYMLPGFLFLSALFALGLFLPFRRFFPMEKTKQIA